MDITFDDSCKFGGIKRRRFSPSPPALPPPTTNKHISESLPPASSYTRLEGADADMLAASED